MTLEELIAQLQALIDQAEGGELTDEESERMAQLTDELNQRMAANDAMNQRMAEARAAIESGNATRKCSGSKRRYCWRVLTDNHNNAGKSGGPLQHNGV